MRVVSLAPSATATLQALGAAESVVGVTAHCPLDRPVVGGWLNPDPETLSSMDPDLICTCDALQADLAASLSEAYEVCHLEPETLEDVLSSFETLASAVDRRAAGNRLRAASRRRLETVEAAVGDRPRPTVYCEEWSDPPMAAGNWVPDAVRAAGGRYPFLEAGERSRPVDETTVREHDPDHVVLHVCGHGDRVSPSTVEGRVPADAAVHVVDDSLLNQPSPRLVDGIERLATLLHPESVDATSPERGSRTETDSSESA